MVAFSLIVALATTGLSSAHGVNANAFSDSFANPGPLAAGPNDPYEIKNGFWGVTDQSSVDAFAPTSQNFVLVQNSKAPNPNDPIVFIRDKVWRQFTAQVTVAMLDSTSALGDLPVNASAGLAFRAPLSCPPNSPNDDCDPSDLLADYNNLYLFQEVVTGVSRQFPTGKIYALFKRVARGYYLLSTKTVDTWTDFTQPHALKVAVGGGHIEAFVDGRLVIDHVDRPSPDVPTLDDPFPGLPFDAGAVGLRTSSTRAWFDDFSVVGNDGFEGRATAVEAYTQYGEPSQIRHGATVETSNELARLGQNPFDTGFQYHDHDFSTSTVSQYSASGGDPALGSKVYTAGSDDTVTSSAELSGVKLTVGDPSGSVTVGLQADAIRSMAVASCDATSSTLDLVNATLTISMHDVPGMPDTTDTIPLPLQYKPNTVIFSEKPLISIVAHEERTFAGLHRVEATALRIVIGASGAPQVPGQQPLPVLTPPIDIAIGQAVAGRYCS